MKTKCTRQGDDFILSIAIGRMFISAEEWGCLEADEQTHEEGASPEFWECVGGGPLKLAPSQHQR